jgi:sodium-dependent phosphate transporter
LSSTRSLTFIIRWIAAVTLGAGFALAALAALFFVPYVHCKVVKKDYTLKLWDIWQGPLLFKRVAPADAQKAKVPNYAVLQHDGEVEPPKEEPKPDTGSDEFTAETKVGTEEAKLAGTATARSTDDSIEVYRRPNGTADAEKSAPSPHEAQDIYKMQMAQARAQHHALLRKNKGPLGWAMRRLHDNPPGAGSIYELHNLKALMKRLPAMVVVALLYGLHYDIHRAQLGILGTPEGKRMERVYAHAPKYENEVEYLYSFVQIITACTASFAHGANDVGNAVGVWAAMYSAWSTGATVGSKAPVPLWQIAVIALTICFGFITCEFHFSPVMEKEMGTDHACFHRRLQYHAGHG